MRIGLIGKKIGMTQKFFESGEAIPVTVLQVEPGKVVDVITKDKRGYSALLVGYGHVKSSKLTKAMKGFYAKKSLEAKKILKEYRIEDTEAFKPGADVTLEVLKDKKFVDIRSKTIGKGFAGVMKRYNFGGLRASHGVSVSHRSHGSTGQRQDPGKVFKGKKMAGHMGDKFRTTQGLEIVETDIANNLLYLRGSIPGSKNTYVEIMEAVKVKNKTTAVERLKTYYEDIETAKLDKKDKKNVAKQAKADAKAAKEAAKSEANTEEKKN
ncbi:MAG: 50S ribosomal protein L3 [Proteobacteria bacterium]|nr:50S ribosomal protein L3 [Pseudomonadota bacterium]